MLNYSARLLCNTKKYYAIKTLGIIPARAGSKRLPDKNKKLLAGKALVRYTIEAASQSKLIQDWVLTTDDEDILSIGAEYEWLHCIRRPAAISGDDAKSITYVHHALEQMGKPYDATCIVQVTSPFTLGEDIDGTVALLASNPNTQGAVSIQKLDFAQHPIKLKTLGNDLKLHPFLEAENGRMSAQELPEIFVRNGSVYVTRMASVEAGSVIGEPCLGYLMPRERSLDINDPIDFAFAAFLMSS